VVVCLFGEADLVRAWLSLNLFWIELLSSLQSSLFKSNKYMGTLFLKLFKFSLNLTVFVRLVRYVSLVGEISFCLLLCFTITLGRTTFLTTVTFCRGVYCSASLSVSGSVSLSVILNELKVPLSYYSSKLFKATSQTRT
jgi:hypothetical protein